MRITNETRAANLYTYLLVHIGEPYLHPDLAPVIGMEAGEGFRRVLRRASELAAADDLCLRTACGANENTVMLTDDADETVDSILHVGQTRRGVEARETRMARFAAEHALTGSDAALLAPLLRLSMDQRAATDAAIADVARAMIERRRMERQAETTEVTP